MFFTGTSIAQRIKLNDIGQNNGEFQVWANGVEIMNIVGLSFRSDDTSRVRGCQIQTFMGGKIYAPFLVALSVGS